MADTFNCGCKASLYRFRGSCPYPDCYDSSGPSQLDMDVPVKIGILRSGPVIALSDSLRWQAFHRICCLAKSMAENILS